GAALRFADRQLAELDPGAGHHPLAERAGPGREIQTFQIRDELTGGRQFDVDDHHLLLRREPHARRAVPLGEVRDETQLMAGDPPRSKREPDERATVLLLM